MDSKIDCYKHIEGHEQTHELSESLKYKTIMLEFFQA